MTIPLALAILFGFLALVGLILWWLAYRAPVGFEGDDGFEYGEPPPASHIPNQTFTDTPLRFAERDEGGR